jgi:NADH-quinone oxidoreductase subunit G
LKYFYIDNIKFNYILEFDTQNSKNNWKQNIPLIEYCESLGITLPHYCYHKDLSIAGNCRMCLIELKKSPKPIVSCAMNAKSSLASNTEIYTNSPLVKKARENIMEFLLLNHPLDCPICDQGGECDLQDQSLFFGITKKRFYNFKRIVTNKNLGPIVKTVMTRCIHCTRCIRFATEVAGIEDLGIFGRGVNSEIGTYIDKLFRSELSGNIIDICPVGALTQKPYPFVGRIWELKKIYSIDPADGFGLDIQVFLKNNKIIKTLPGYNHNNLDNHNQWISDKTRFLFDGMFSSNRNFNKFIMNNSKKTNLSWKNLFKKLIILIYFFDHLKRHVLKINPFIILFEETVSIEIVNILLLLKKKYSFFEIRRTNKLKIACDFESNLQLNNVSNPNLLSLSNLCLLIGTDIRYESPYLNLKLKKRFSKGNFQVFNIGSNTNLTFPCTILGSNLKKLKSIVEGNSSICTKFKNNTNLMSIINTELLNRNDRLTIFNLMEIFNKVCSKKNWTIFNLLNTSLNSTGINYLNSFKNINKNDLSKTNGLFCINNNIKTYNSILQLIELELLNYFILNNKVLIEQNNKNIFLDLKNKLNILNYIYLPNNVFFENFGHFINTEGTTKQTTKLISSMQDSKDDWQILRKLISELKNIEFSSNTKYNIRTLYNCNNLFNFKNFISFLYLNTKSLSKISFYLRNQNQYFKISMNYKIKKLKLLTTQLKKWIEDFYLGGYDNYSNNSETLISCSIALRTNSTTFQ